ncbi:MAG: hypothetical protein GY756_10510, partial [bacterium]|nr:hypothetical protein [bacterium]
IFGIFEFYQWADSIKRCEYYSRWRDDHLHLDNRHELGYLPKKNSSWTASRYFDNDMVYKCIYTINKHGYRISPPHKEKVKGCLLFFGCSFTYGEGVNDTETLPYVTGILLEENYAVYNFGIHGNGTHQMLFTFENGIVENIVKHNVTHVIYQTIYPEHVNRLLGLQPWSKRDPRYILGEHEEVIYKGHFDDDNSASHTSIQKILNKLNNQLNKSYLALRIKKKINRKLSNNNIRL